MARNLSLLDPDCLGQADGAGGPPTDWGELVQVHDDRAIFQASPVELPDIDIHSL
jgi:hypothetical protein